MQSNKSKSLMILTELIQNQVTIIMMGYVSIQTKERVKLISII